MLKAQSSKGRQQIQYPPQLLLQTLIFARLLYHSCLALCQLLRKVTLFRTMHIDATFGFAEQPVLFLFHFHTHTHTQNTSRISLSFTISHLNADLQAQQRSTASRQSSRAILPLQC